MAGRLLAARFFNNKTELMSYKYVPTTVVTPNNKQEKYSALITLLLTEVPLNLWNGRSILKRDTTAMLSS